MVLHAHVDACPSYYDGIPCSILCLGFDSNVTKQTVPTSSDEAIFKAISYRKTTATSIGTEYTLYQMELFISV